MECRACGYIHRYSFGIKGNKTLVGDEEFIEILIPNIKIKNPKPHVDYGYMDTLDASLYACPKCKTVLLET